jgi:hypothetical protein
MPRLDMHDSLKRISASLPKDGIDRNNAIAVFLMGALPAVGGSTISVILYVSLVWAILSLALGRFEFRLTRSDRMLAWTFTIFAGAITATALLGEHIKEVPHKLVWLLGFLSPWVIIPRLRAGSTGNYLAPYVTGAAVGAIGACAIALIQLKVFGTRPEGGAGNAAVFAIMSLCLMSLGALNIDSGSTRRKILAPGAILGGSLAILLSATRGVALAIPPIILLTVAYAPAAWRPILSRRTLLFSLAAAVLVISVAWNQLEGRVLETIQDVQGLSDGDLTSNVGERLRLWHAAMQVIVHSPILGFGIQNRMDVLLPSLRQDGIFVYSFTHPHNGFLTFALDGGMLALAALIAMLCAPIMASVRAPHDGNYRLRLFMALAVTGAYGLCGMTQIMFKHDIMDSFFIFFAIVIAASVPEEAVKRT